MVSCLPTRGVVSTYSVHFCMRSSHIDSFNTTLLLIRNSQNEITNTKTESQNTQNAFSLGIAVRKSNNNHL